MNVRTSARKPKSFGKVSTPGESSLSFMLVMILGYGNEIYKS